MTVEPGDKGTFWRSPFGITLGVFLAAGTLLLVLEHGAHLLGAWPILLLLICVAMHLFMHGSHGHGGVDER